MSSRPLLLLSVWSDALRGPVFFFACSASESLNLNALLAAKAGPRPPFPHSRCPADVTRSIIDRRASLFSSGRCCRAARRAVSDVSYKSGSRQQRALLGTASPGQNDRLPAAPSHWTSTSRGNNRNNEERKETAANTRFSAKADTAVQVTRSTGQSTSPLASPVLCA